MKKRVGRTQSPKSRKAVEADWPPPASVYVARAVAFVALLLIAACPRSINDPGFNLSLSPTTASLFVDDSTRLTATLRDGNGDIVSTSFSWTSDSPTVASVDSVGTVKAEGPGSTVIRVSARGESANATVTVAEDNGQTLTVSPTSANLIVDGTQRFTATLKDRNGNTIPATPEWSSNNTAVATVDGSGTARGMRAGSATIQAKVGGLTANVPITVVARGSSVVLVGAGDIASGGSGDEQTADLLDDIPGTVFTLGDNAYPDGSADDYSTFYAPSWGRHKSRTRPVPGNHEYNTPSASGYFDYFGSAAGDPSKGYYSYEVGGWLILALNSNAAMTPGSSQEQFVRSELAARRTKCALAYWHHPRFSSGIEHGSSLMSQGVFQALYDGGADVVLTGHDHLYERFAPQNPSAQLDMDRGIRQFVVGTGGAGLYDFGAPQPNSEVRATRRGVLKLTLYAEHYEWQFVTGAGSSGDAGSASCH